MNIDDPLLEQSLYREVLEIHMQKGTSYPLFCLARCSLIEVLSLLPLLMLVYFSEKHDYT